MFNNSEKIVTTQKEFDKIKSDFVGQIIIKDTKESICINRSFEKAYVSVYDNATIKSVSDNATIESVSDNATIESVSDNATIKSVYGNATIESVSDNATIKSVSGNATIESVYDNATIKSVYGNATIKYVYGNATIESVYGNATIKSVYGNATILLMTGLASLVLLYSANKIVAKGINIIRQIGTQKIDIEMSNSVTFIQVKESISEKPSFELYSKLYPCEIKSKKVILYKAVHKINEKYIADYDKKTEYKIGEIAEIENNPTTDNSCTYGIHLSHKVWAINFGKWDDMALLECETDIKDIVVSKDCDGKVRTSKIKVLREVPKDEY